MLNGEVYEVCPKSLSNDHPIEQFLVELYFECKENKHFPVPGSLMMQTAFVYDLFKFCDSKVGRHWDKQNEKREYEYNKMLEKMKRMTPSGKK